MVLRPGKTETGLTTGVMTSEKNLSILIIKISILIIFTPIFSQIYAQTVFNDDSSSDTLDTNYLFQHRISCYKEQDLCPIGNDQKSFEYFFGIVSANLTYTDKKNVAKQYKEDEEMKSYEFDGKKEYTIDMGATKRILIEKIDWIKGPIFSNSGALFVEHSALFLENDANGFAYIESIAPGGQFGNRLTVLGLNADILIELLVGYQEIKMRAYSNDEELEQVDNIYFRHVMMGTNVAYEFSHEQLLPKYIKLGFRTFTSNKLTFNRQDERLNLTGYQTYIAFKFFF